MAVISRGGRALEPVPAPPLPAAGRPAAWRAAMLACVVLAAVSLLGPHVPTYDPTAWLIWGREIIHGDLSTTVGPSWKPLPMLFTIPAALFGDTAAPLLWLVVARAAGLFSFVLAFRLAARLAAGPNVPEYGLWGVVRDVRWVAGAIAVVALLLENVFVFHFARGNSEGLQVAVTLWALERHLDGRPRDAFLLGLAGGLLRPELWPFVAAYGLWMIVRDWREEPPWRTIALVIGGGVALMLLWFVPEYIGSGQLLRSATRAREPVEGSPGQAAFPFLATFTNSASALIVPVYVGGLLAVAFALRRPRERIAVLGIAALATVLMLSVAASAQLGFTGNQRYVTLPAALVCVLAGVGWTDLGAAVRRRLDARWAAALALALLAGSVPFVVSGVSRLQDRLHTVRVEAHNYGTIADAIAAAGGEAAVKSCGTVYTGPYNTQMVAWDLHLHESQVGINPAVPGTTIAGYTSDLAHDPRFPAIARADRWVVGSSCARP